MYVSEVVSRKEKVVRAQNFKDLLAWQHAHQVVIGIYKFTKTFPQSEQFGLTSQMRRAAVSITSNLAEGFGRQSLKEKVQFYSIAQGSTTELQNQILISRDVEFIQNETFETYNKKLEEVHKIIMALIRSIRSRF